MKEKLKPCPFCGSENIVIERSPISGGFCVTCNSCFASSAYFDCENKAIKMWNKITAHKTQYGQGYIDGYAKAQKEFTKRLEALRAAYLVQDLDILKEKNQ